MDQISLPAYETLYYSLWELSCRFADFVTFRVIGRSHDERMIPMLEIGTGKQGFYCVTGMQSRDYPITAVLPDMLQEYCYAFEKKWRIDHFYSVRRLLTQTRLLIIPLLNPDGYEIRRQGITAIRNPVYRQMLHTEYVTDLEKYNGNGRGIRFERLFLKPPEKELCMEYENRAIRSMLLEYPGEGMLILTRQKTDASTGIFYCKKAGFPFFYRAGRELAGNLRYSAGAGTLCAPVFHRPGRTFPEGSIETYYTEMTGKPSVLLRFSKALKIVPDTIANYPLECLNYLQS